MFDLIIGLGESLVKHGLSLSFFGAALFVILRQRPSKRWIRKHFPRLMRDDADIMNYEARQIRIEQDVRAIKEHLGVTGGWNAEKLNSTVNTGKNSSTYLAQLIALSARKSIMRRKIPMRDYLKKLGRTKFQAFLFATLTNLVTLGLFMTGTVDLDGAVNQWMPMINLIVQLVVSAVYMGVEGSIDKARAKAEVNHGLDSAASDSEGA